MKKRLMSFSILITLLGVLFSSSLASSEKENRSHEKDQPLCEEKKKREALKSDLKKIKKEEERISKIIEKIEEENQEGDKKRDEERTEEKERKKEKREEGFSPNLSSLFSNSFLMFQLYGNSFSPQVSPSLFSPSYTGSYSTNSLQDGGMVVLSSPFRNLSSSQLSRYANLALGHRLKRRLNSSQSWALQFDQEGQLKSTLFGGLLNQTIYGYR